MVENKECKYWILQNRIEEEKLAGILIERCEKKLLEGLIERNIIIFTFQKVEKSIVINTFYYLTLLVKFLYLLSPIHHTSHFSKFFSPVASIKSCFLRVCLLSADVFQGASYGILPCLRSFVDGSTF